MERKFEVDDRVRVNDSSIFDKYLQKSSRIGTIIVITGISKELCWLRMDKRVKKEERLYRPFRPSIIPRKLAYLANLSNLELIEPAKAQKPLDIWSFDPPKVKVEPQEERIPLVWGNKVLV